MLDNYLWKHAWIITKFFIAVSDHLKFNSLFRLEDKIILIKHQNKCSTACKPFNLSVPAKKIAEVIEGDEVYETYNA